MQLKQIQSSTKRTMAKTIKSLSRVFAPVLIGLPFLIAGDKFVREAHAQSVSNKDLVVFCLDEKRGHVSKVRSGECRGRVIDSKEAKRIRDARATRLRAIVGRKETPPFPDLNRRSHGTGFFISYNGFMLTNDHVVTGCNGVSVETPAGEVWKAQVVSTLKRYDLALLRVTERPIAIAEFSSTSFVAIKDRADLVGYPTQGIAPRLPIFTPAQRSTHHGRPGDRALFQIKGDVRGGNSGGPVLNANGQVIGVIFAQLNLPVVAKQTGRVPDDTGFAVANEVVFRFLKRNGVLVKVIGQTDQALPREAVFARSRDFVARIGCWK